MHIGFNGKVIIKLKTIMWTVIACFDRQSQKIPDRVPDDVSKL